MPCRPVMVAALLPLLLAPASGCLESRVRSPIAVTAELLDVVVHAAPVLASGATIAGDEAAPDAMGVARLRLHVPGGLQVELTQVAVSSVAGDDEERPGHVASVRLDPATTAPRRGDWPLLVSEGATLTVHFRLLDEDGVPRVEPGARLNVTVAASWRYDAGGRFDASRASAVAHVEPMPVAAGATAGTMAWLADEDEPSIEVHIDEMPEVAPPATLFLVGAEGDAVAVAVAIDTENGVFRGPAPSYVPEPLAYGLVVAPWPLADGEPVELVIVVGPGDVGDAP